MDKKQEKKQDAAVFHLILNNLGKVIQGKEKVLRETLIAFIAGGHILLEDVPGVGKTTLAKALATSIDSSYQRVQFTPDLLPADIIGINIYQPKTGEFEFRKGPVFSDLLLADEINRSSPRTQSALLEAMSEKQATVSGKTMSLGEMFTVIATQNPVDFHGTYPLPEAQLDRFFIRLRLGYPDIEHEGMIIQQQQLKHPLEDLETVATREEILQVRKDVRQVSLKKQVTAYLLEIVKSTREDPRIKLGISPRGSLAFSRAAQVYAWSEERDYVIPDDLKAMAVPVLSHRLMLDTKTRHSGTTKEEIIKDIMDKTSVPVGVRD